MSDPISATSGLDHTHKTGAANSTANKVSIKQYVPQDTVEICNTHHTKEVVGKNQALGINETDMANYVSLLKEMPAISAEDAAILEQEILSKTSENLARDLGFNVVS